MSTKQCNHNKVYLHEEPYEGLAVYCEDCDEYIDLETFEKEYIIIQWGIVIMPDRLELYGEGYDGPKIEYQINPNLHYVTHIIKQPANE